MVCQVREHGTGVERVHRFDRRQFVIVQMHDLQFLEMSETYLFRYLGDVVVREVEFN
jgi:hypothetical protein